MQKLKQHLLAICTALFFILFALASKVNKIHYGAFNYGNRVEDKADTRNYIIKNDGTKIYGEKISWKSGLIVKDQIKIDDQKFKISEIRGYQYDGVFHGRLKNEYIKRIIHGKVNVYVQFTEVSTSTTDMNGHTRYSSYTRTDQYGQVGDDGSMIGLAGQKDIKKLLSDCPLAVEMVSLSNSKMRKTIKKNRNYMNDVFDVYNNGCHQ